ncbi:nucleotidyltransferase domain-containing protein [Pseudarthrobacter sp. NKDBFgelt]|uniref:nucleotidyltransferase domain-containing protein n=1 Tax=Pseudarthrobacter sp. NKDBFgelt TaxID=3384443 RepID=UPI0038D372E0
MAEHQSIQEIARAFVQEEHPGACASILGGSAATGTATSTSDLDIALLYPAGHSNYAQTSRYRGWIVEAFIHTPESLQFWYRMSFSEVVCTECQKSSAHVIARTRRSLHPRLRALSTRHRLPSGTPAPQMNRGVCAWLL